MKRKNIADKPVTPVSEGTAAAAAPNMARAPRASASANHKHKKALTASPEPAPDQTPVSEPIPPAAETPAATSAFPSQEQIAIRAYLIAESRGFAGGSPADDWFQAERELLDEMAGRV